MTLHHPEPLTMTPRGHYVFVDGPSIDGTLGRVIGQPPGPDTRPDWRRLETFVKQTCGPAPYTATFVFWAPGQQGFMHFLRTSGFMIALGDRFVPGQSCADLIRQRIAALNAAADPEQSWQLIVGTHNEDLIAELPLLADTAEQIGVFGFLDQIPETPELDQRINFYDIEDDASLFRARLPRVDYDDTEDGYDYAAPVYQPPLAERPALEPAAAAPVFQRQPAQFRRRRRARFLPDRRWPQHREGAGRNPRREAERRDPPGLGPSARLRPGATRKRQTAR